MYDWEIQNSRRPLREGISREKRGLRGRVAAKKSQRERARGRGKKMQQPRAILAQRKAWVKNARPRRTRPACRCEIARVPTTPGACVRALHDTTLPVHLQSILFSVAYSAMCIPPAPSCMRAYVFTRRMNARAIYVRRCIRRIRLRSYRNRMIARWWCIDVAVGNEWVTADSADGRWSTRTRILKRSRDIIPTIILLSDYVEDTD